MRQSVAPETTARAEAYRLWMSSPMPMVTLTKSLDVTPLVRAARRRGCKFNMLLCWCIGRAAAQMEQFYLLPAQDAMYRYDRLAVNVIVNNAQGGINSCDIPVSDDLESFNADYLRLTALAAAECRSSFLDDHVIVGTSAMVQTELDSITNQYTERFLNPMTMWGRYRRERRLWGCRYRLPLSFQFHHAQMDGGHAARFLALLQQEIAKI